MNELAPENYGLGVAREFRARHFLFGGDWGAENQPHEHAYRVEVILNGPELDSHGYLTDIALLENLLEDLAGRFAGKLLNDLPEFAGLNPSLEHFCRIWWEELAESLPLAGLSELAVKMWENDIAWASYAREL
ncbi:MAG: 6-carboxytetrahydropterin synthase [Deltaproteobacteria bacterium]|nr:6-carboxytetrahydropterin synthase [Deltaproteobacteria bacterium]